MQRVSMAFCSLLFTSSVVWGKSGKRSVLGHAWDVSMTRELPAVNEKLGCPFS